MLTAPTEPGAWGSRSSDAARTTSLAPSTLMWLAAMAIKSSPDQQWRWMVLPPVVTGSPASRARRGDEVWPRRAHPVAERES